MKLYVVLNTTPDGVASCEILSDIDVALKTGLELAAQKSNGHPEWVAPVHQLLADKSNAVSLLDTTQGMVVVIEKEVETSLKFVDEVPTTTHLDAVVAIDPFDTTHLDAGPSKWDAWTLDPDLPFGWTTNNKAFCLKDGVDPYEMMPPTQLSEPKQWALITARVSKSPSFRVKTSLGTFVQASALQELKKKTPVGEEIVKDQIAKLQALVDDEMENINF